MAVDPAGAYTARDVGNKSPAWLNKIITKPQVESEVVILDSFENRFRHRGDIKLMLATQPAIASNDSPADTLCEKQSTDLIVGGRINRSKQVAGLQCEFDSVRIEVAAQGCNLGFRRAAEEPEANAE